MRIQALLLIVGMLLAAPAAAQGSGIIRCESDDGRPRECATGPLRDARIVRQLSRSPCVEGTSWGTHRNGIWVSQGCRAEFHVVGRSRGGDGWDGGWPGEGGWAGHGTGMVRCESMDGRWSHCEIPRRSRVELARQLSRTPCVRGQTWGVDDGAVWVSGGCRGDFQVLARNGGYGMPLRFSCASDDGRPRTCNAPARGEIRLVRQHSRSPCIEGQTWGAERRGVWVSGGCRGEFEVARGRW